MFNPEKLLNMVISELAGSASQVVSGKKTKQKKKKKRKAKGISDSLVSSLSSGKGLMTAIAMGVGAYEILKSKTNSKASAGNTEPAPPLPASSSQAIPPPLPGKGSGLPAKPASPSSIPKKEENDSLKIASRLIEVMIAAAWADGEMDAAEEARILSRFQGQGLDREEKEFLLNALHEPKSIAQLSQGVEDPRIAQTMYSLAVATLVIDTEAERNWLDQLATTLAISQEMQNFIEEDM